MSACCYVCNQCPLSFTSLQQLESHLAQHVFNKLQQQQDSPQEPEMAEMGHSPSSSELSPDCEDDDTQLDTTQEESEENALTCKFCFAKFEDQTELTTHYTTLHRDKPQYECEVCNTVFAVKRELSTHMRVHSGEQPHKCSQCGKEFGTRQLLKKHWLWHSGERSHVCQHCGKAFFQKGHLTQHLMIHSGGRPHQCSLCQKTFIFKFDLNRHMKIHAERGFACTDCGRSFLRQSSLDEHQLKCKAKNTVNVAPSSNVSTPVKTETTESSFAFSTPSSPLLQYSQEQMAKVAQTLLAQQQQQRAVAQLLNNPLALSTFCMLCSKPFPSQSALAAHMYITHLNNQNLPPPLATQPVIHPIAQFVRPVEQLKSDVDEEQMHCDTATNSCASSPHKEVLSSTARTPPLVESKPFAVFEEQNRKNEQLQQALDAKTEELKKLRQVLKMVLSSASNVLMECSQSTKNPLLAHTSAVFQQLDSTLCNID